MKTATINLYTFAELSDKAKERARDWYRQGIDYPWHAENMASVKAFCDDFGVSVNDWRLGDYGYSFISTDAENANFRGLKLRNVNKDKMPTGFWMDCTLYGTFYRHFEKTGDALAAFNHAIDAAVENICRDIECHYEDETIDEMLTINEYDFTEDGKIY
jgi:hypothetical protein